VELNRTQQRVLAQVERLQSQIPGLCFHHPHQAVSTGPLVPGCEICVRSYKRYMSFQLGFACNSNCAFCFVETYDAQSRDPDEVYHRRALLKQFRRKKEGLEGVSLTGGEPLLYLTELEECVSEMRAAKPSLHFWVFTNGILADEERLRVLQSLGIQEIRFNLAASGYTGKALENLALAREKFKYLVVEVPSYPEQKEALVACLPELDRIGINQLNLQELWITPANAQRLEGEGYQTGLLFAKKYFLYGSRQMTYEVMQRCVAEGYGFTVNDCSASQFGVT